MLCVLFLQDKFIEYLLKGTQKLTPAFALANNETISHIINLSSAILLLSNNKCDQETNPNSKVSSKQQSDSKGLPAVFFLCGCDVVFYPCVAVSFWRRVQDLSRDRTAVGYTSHREVHLQTSNRHNLPEQVSIPPVANPQNAFGSYQPVWDASMQLRTEQLYFFSHKAADLNHAVLGSEEEGGYIKLPSFLAMQSQLGGNDNIITQVCLCCHRAWMWPRSTFRHLQRNH